VSLDQESPNPTERDRGCCPFRCRLIPIKFDYEGLNSGQIAVVQLYPAHSSETSAPVVTSVIAGRFLPGLGWRHGNVPSNNPKHSQPIAHLFEVLRDPVLHHLRAVPSPALIQGEGPNE
jgi:hypothetical protein